MYKSEQIHKRQHTDITRSKDPGDVESAAPFHRQISRQNHNGPTENHGHDHHEARIAGALQRSGEDNIPRIEQAIKSHEIKQFGNNRRQAGKLRTFPAQKRQNKMDLSYSKKATRKRIKSKMSESKKGKSDFIKGFREGYGE